MRTLIVVGLLVACGGSAGNSVSPAGTWALTDTLKQGGCTASAGETLTVVSAASGYALHGYTMTASYCGPDFCELQGSLNGLSRDVMFFSDNTASGNRSEPGCFYSTSGQRAH